MKQYSLIEEAAVLNEVAWGTLLKATGKRLTQGNFGDKLQTLKSFGGNVIRNMTGPQSATRQFLGGVVRSSNAAHTGRNLLSAAKMRGTNPVAAKQMATKGQRLVDASSKIAKHSLARTGKVAAVNTAKFANHAANALVQGGAHIAKGVGSVAGGIGKGLTAAAPVLKRGANNISNAMSNATKNKLAMANKLKQDIYKRNV